ncbi:hypothetical protein AB6A40_003382 [Gnathostoma spinigerum]|uniref:Uncharacterized protein n=1 Tax=Gnathostoma spinigerum TaxID=75299 RepID=A0ABD6E9E2_9BILA
MVDVNTSTEHLVVLLQSTEHSEDDLCHVLQALKYITYGNKRRKKELLSQDILSSILKALLAFAVRCAKSSAQLVLAVIADPR